MLYVLGQLGSFFANLFAMAANPGNMLILVGATVMGIIFGATPGLTATLGVALLTTVTYGMGMEQAMFALLGVYVGAVYGGCYSSILINIPGTAAAAATAVDGYPIALKGEGAKAIGVTTTASAIGTFFGMLVLVTVAPVVVKFALQFRAFEFFLLALFGIIMSGWITTPDTPYKGWIAGFFGLFLATIGRDRLQFFPRFTFGLSQLDSGIEVVPVLIGAFGIPQIIDVLRNQAKLPTFQKLHRILPEFWIIKKHMGNILRSALIGVGVGAVPGIGEDIAGWLSYGSAKNTSKHPEAFGKGEYAGIVASETANNSCIGGAIIPLLTLGIPGSPPAAMLLGALLLHGVQPGPMINFDHPGFIMKVSAILLLASFAMWICGLLLARQVVKVLRIPAAIFMPVIGALCIIGSYSIGMDIMNLFLMLPIGIIAYFITDMKYPIAPLVMGVILGPMADENLRRALMVSKGSFLPIFQRPVNLILFFFIMFAIASQLPAYKKIKDRLFKRKAVMAQ